MTEQQIEAWAERQMDDIDRRYLSGTMTQAEYDAAVRALDDQTEAMLAHRFGVRH